MYKLLLCVRYLRTRYIALASIVSVTLGVATMIVVNSVMAGFSTEMRDRIRGLLADVVVETHSLDGVRDPLALSDRIRALGGDDIAALTMTVETYGVLSYQVQGQPVNQPVTIVGIDPRSKAEVSPFPEYLENYKPTVEGGEVVAAAERSLDQPPDWELTASAMRYRRRMAAIRAWSENRGWDGAPPPTDPRSVVQAGGDGFDPDAEGVPFDDSELFGADGGVAHVSGEADAHDPFNPSDNPFDGPPAEPVDPAAPLAARVYIGQQIVSYPYADPDTGEVKTQLLLRPGQDVQLVTFSVGQPPKPVHFAATVTDLFKCGMSEYDSRLVFCNLEELQRVRGMAVPDESLEIAVGSEVEIHDGGPVRHGQVQSITGPLATVRVGRWHEAGETVEVPLTACSPVRRSVTTVQIKLAPGADGGKVATALRGEFDPAMYSVRTWEQKQGPLLAAVDVETTILNVLLFMIVAVAGFGILAIFYMIVVEKTRDIGILKALGAGNRGVMSIFLSYGLSLGVVGAGAGVVLGLLFVSYINEIERAVTVLTGRKVFDERIYYFPEIPTRIDPFTVCWVACGAVAIAVAASILPARRAAALHPVQALRYE